MAMQQEIKTISDGAAKKYEFGRKILTMVQKNKIMHIRQLAECVEEDISTVKKEVKEFVFDERLFYAVEGGEENQDIIVSCEELKEKFHELDGHYKAFWIYLDFKAKANHVDFLTYDGLNYSNLFCAALSVNGEFIEILYVPKTKETDLSVLHNMERYLTEEDRENLHRIIVIDEESQIEKMKRFEVIGVDSYVLVESGGATKYIQA
ncbi:DUF5697 family protein [Eubacterium oxidoreducens]|uniref:Uncharacterized protein n=1 Tax=Eubacterium oxidoreducens TaxID=1732 RepID=A0A1G6C3Q3_EUBOX|nr:DUF5697 family protein [Eubacterium oxidoreducens]SDB27497.1 hypothetical protein SAMN02910417_02033 [Eubacterium oxidoreducens]